MMISKTRFLAVCLLFFGGLLLAGTVFPKAVFAESKVNSASEKTPEKTAPKPTKSATTIQKNLATIPPDKVKQLVKLLENDAERKVFVDNLKTASAAIATRTVAPPKIAVVEQSGVTKYINDLSNEYKKLLKKYKISQTVVGKSILTAFFILLYIALLFPIKKLKVKVISLMARVKNKFSIKHNRLDFYLNSLNKVLLLGLFLMLSYAISFAWGVVDSLWGDESWLQVLTVRGVNLLVLAAVAALALEAVEIAFSMWLHRANKQGDTRLRTLIPIARNVVLLAFSCVLALILLSEIGINIMPLLAGAGIVGIAIGFGAQSMVKDFLTGFMIIFEDLIQVGDVAKVGGCMGVVEKITIRKVQLRDTAGVVYTIPFGEITTVENWTKDFSYAVLDVAVSYHEDTDKVIAALRDVESDLRDDPEFKKKILEPMEVLGVDKFTESSFVIRARIKTRPIQQWSISREFNRRMKILFEQKGIETPFSYRPLMYQRTEPIST